MKKLSAVLCVLAAIGCGSGASVNGPAGPGAVPGESSALSLRLTVDVGEAKYSAESLLDNTKSEWTATFVRPRVALDYRRPDGLEVTGEFLAFASPKSKETWDLDGVSVGDNDLQIEGVEGRLLGGWGVELEDIGRVSILAGGSYRLIEFERKDAGNINDTDFSLPIAEIEARVSLPISSVESDLTGSFDMAVVGGWIIEPEGEDANGDTIEGDDGYLFRVRVGFTINPHPQLSFFIGGFYERVEIEGGVDGANEWPDNTISVGGAEVGAIWRY